MTMKYKNCNKSLPYITEITQLVKLDIDVKVLSKLSPQKISSNH